MDQTAIVSNLLNPCRDARNLTRWWWYGCAVSKEEIVRELDFMHEAGLGGVELQIMYPLQPDCKEKGRKNFDYMSPEYLDVLNFAITEAEKRGMRFDLTLGSSWPFGGPFVSEELSGQSVLPFELDVMGPCTFYKDLTTVVYGKVVGAVVGKMENAQMLPDTIVDISDHIIDKYLFNWPWGTEVKDVEIPEGLHKIVLFVSSDKRQRVLKPLKGGEGLIIDHNRKEALREFLSYAGDPIIDAVGEGRIKNIFCDSLEVFGHNWTDILYDEFLKRRGYDLHPYIYALWGEVRGMTNQIRHDFQLTMAELTVENFYQELTAWSHERGSESRIQAHGTWGEVLQAYAAADVPEGETFSDFDRYEVNTIHRRLAVSAGHVYHKPIISNESFTWLRFPRFVVTLENIKEAADSIFLDGINQIVNHGYSYSEPEDDEMIAFYASCNINHNNTWWKYYPAISRYINRVCTFLQMGRPVVTTAIYLPEHDVWAEMPIADTHMCMKLDERLDKTCINPIQKAGYWFDYINDDVVSRLEEYPYDTLLLIECDRIPVETLEAICRFVKRGGRLLAAQRMPSMSCGLVGYEDATAKIRALSEELLRSDRVILTADKFTTLVDALKAVKLPDVDRREHPDTVGFVHRRTDEEDIYFVSNISKEAITERFWFKGMTGSFTVYDPMTCREQTVRAVKTDENGVEITLEMEANQSLLFFFGRELKPRVCSCHTVDEPLLDLTGGFTLEADGHTCTPAAGWEQEEALRYFSGSGVYRKHFTLTREQYDSFAAGPRVLLQLEELHETAEVVVNGVPAGKILMHPYTIDVGGLLRPGDNELELTVTNCLINRMIDPDYPEPILDKVIPEWPYTTGALQFSRKDRLYNQRERDQVPAPRPSGILGRVQLIRRTSEA